MSSKHKKDKYPPLKHGKAGKTPLFEPRCYTGHPAMKLGSGEVYGGSAHTPMVDDADVYVALEKGAGFVLSDPWEEHQRTNVRFTIQDSYAPEDKELPRFKKMVTYLCTQVQAGKKVHVGCIGGHGRTGTVLAAMAAEMGHKDAIQYVRKNYCEKAVESSDQVDFLMKNYGVDYANANKTYSFSKGAGKDSELYGGLWAGQSTNRVSGKGSKKKVHPTVNSALSAIDGGKANHTVFPMASNRSLWLEPLVKVKKA